MAMGLDGDDEAGGLATRQLEAERRVIRNIEADRRADRQLNFVLSPEERRRVARRNAAAESIEGAAGARFLDRTLVPLAEAVAADAERVQAAKGPLPRYGAPLLALHPETLALLALRIIYQRAVGKRARGRPDYADIAATIGKACYWEWTVRREDAARRLAEAEAKHVAAEAALAAGEATMRAAETGTLAPEDELPNLRDMLLARNRSRNAAARATEQLQRFEARDWSIDGGVALGGLLLDHAQTLELVTIAATTGGGGLLRRVEAGPALTRRGGAADDAGARVLALPALLPMVAPPRPRVGRRGGGFLTLDDPALTGLVKERDHDVAGAALDAAERDGTLGLTLVAVNALQDTAWRRNQPLLALLTHALEASEPLPGLPDRARLAAIQAELARPDDAREALRARGRAIRSRAQDAGTDLPALATELRALRAALRRDWAAYRGDRGSVGALLRERATLEGRRRQGEALLAACGSLASSVPDDARGERLYFPYQLDYRGRAYSMVPTPNPQGGDTARAALEFAAGKPLGPRGAFWLAVHLANAHGQDKVAFAARVAWVREHDGALRDLARLLDPAAGPPAARLAALDGAARALWAGAEQPWQFLAACREWAQRDDPGFVSRLPVALDGSASGYQHLSALARDRAGAAATNLLNPAPPPDLAVPEEGDPLDRVAPADLYHRVADALRPRVAADAALGKEAAITWCDPATGDATRITRRAVKQGVMTTPYGVTRGGLRRQLLAHLEAEEPGLAEGREEAAEYLAEALPGAIAAVVGQAPAVMAWLKDVATALFTGFGRGVAWTTPAGFPVVVEHYRDKPRVVKWTPPGTTRRRELTLRVPAPRDLGVDLRKQRSTIAPNFVHALDAAHLMLTVRRLHGEGLRHFAVIHDSYGVHACDADQLVHALREEFVRMYRAPLLERCLDAQLAALCEGLSPEKLAALRAGAPFRKLEVLRSTMPVTGDLDLDEVLRARYMFA
jgi:DNA-directed RNA polymerase